ncbi:MAG: hypothetical protein ACHQYP_07115 [Nitrospiria bacterium]
MVSARISTAYYGGLMIFSRTLIFMTALFLVTRAPAGASENSDLDFIPNAVQKESYIKEPFPERKQWGINFVEDEIAFSSIRGDLAVPVPVSQPDWQNRTSVDLNQTWKATELISLRLNDRFDVLEESDLNFPSQGSSHNNFQEGFGSFEILSGTYLEAGRINLKNGIALGFNPTDYFKTRSAVSQATADPSALREVRMGALMVRIQEIGESGALSLSYSPKVTSASAIPLSPGPSLDPLFGQTNATDRILLIFSHNLLDLYPQALIYYENGQSRLGLNVSHVFGKSVVGYAEWSGGNQTNLSTRAVNFGKQTGALTQDALPLPQIDSGEFFQNDASLGFSWANSRKITVNVEYHYHQGGFNKTDLDNWFALGRENSLVISELWYVRLYASDQEEPMMQEELFFRADWQDAIITNLNLNGFAMISPYDGSAFIQMSAGYYLSKDWTLQVLLGAAVGSGDTEYGSLPKSMTTAFQGVRYF